MKTRTIDNWKSHLAWILPRIGDTPLADVNQLVARDLVAEMWAAGLSAKTICNYFGVVSAVVASAIGDDGEQLYPRKWNREFIDLPVVDPSSQRTPSYTARVVEGIISRADHQLAVLYALYAATSLRAGEALGLAIPHLTGSSLRIVQAVWNGALYSPKTRNGIRDVDLSTEVSDMLARLYRWSHGRIYFPLCKRPTVAPVEPLAAQSAPDTQ